MKLNKVLLSLNDCNVKLVDMYGNTIYHVLSIAELTNTILESDSADEILETKVIKIVPIVFKFPDTDSSVSYFSIHLNVRKDI